MTVEAKPKARAVFWDRDGVINVDTGYLHKPSECVFIDGVFEAVSYAHRMGFLNIIITNQSGIGRGYYTEADFYAFSAWLQAEFTHRAVVFDAIYHCPHAPDAGCDCRKPAPGMIYAARNKHNIDLAQSILIGDKDSDMAAGQAAGVGHLVRFDGERDALPATITAAIRAVS